MAIDRWSPMRDFLTLRQAMDHLFDESVVRPQQAVASPADRALRLPIDAYSTESELVLVVPVPGAAPEDVEITIEGETLTIRGEIKPPLENVDYIFNERPYGPFIRSLSLNVPVEAEKAEATFDNGLLTLTIPKAESVKPKTIKIKSR